MKKVLLTLLLVLHVSNADIVKSVYELSGAKEVLKSIPELVKLSNDAQLAQQDTSNIPPQVMKKIQTLPQLFTYSKMEKFVIEGLRRNLSVKDAQAAYTWLSSPLGQKIVAKEVYSATPKGIKASQAFIMRHAMQEQTPTKRKALIKAYVNVSNMEEKSASLLINIGLATVVYMMSDLPENQRPPIETLRSVIEKEAKTQQTYQAQQAYVGALFTYKTLSDDELKQYINFLESTSGKAYIDAVYASLEHSFTSIIKSF